MEKLLAKLKKLESGVIEPNIVKRTLNSIDFSELDYLQYVDESKLDQYHRVNIIDSPFKVFLTIWPPQHLLIPHQHINFWGYVAVLKGLLTETAFVYETEESRLLCHPPKNYCKGDVIFEHDNVIHHLQNPSPSKHLVTVHIYYPPKYGYDGVLIFDIMKRKIAELNAKAPNVSWDHPADHYNKLAENAFSVVNLW
jgi:hypothetical protein